MHLFHISPSLHFSLSHHRLSSSLVADVSVNMRREGKLYSWEDQKWDAEMRREMESKRKRELLEGGGGGGGGREKDVRALVKEAKLSQKQKVRKLEMKLNCTAAFTLSQTVLTLC